MSCVPVYTDGLLDEIERQAIEAEIRARWASGGVTMAELGAAYGVHAGTISAVLSGRTWRTS